MPLHVPCSAGSWGTEQLSFVAWVGQELRPPTPPPRCPKVRSPLPKARGDVELRLVRILGENGLEAANRIAIHQPSNKYAETFAFLYFSNRRDAYKAYDCG